MKVNINMYDCTMDKMMVMEESLTASTAVSGEYYIEVASDIGIDTITQDDETGLQLVEFSLEGPVWNFVANADGSTFIIEISTGLYWTAVPQYESIALLLKPKSDSSTDYQRFLIAPSQYEYIYYATDQAGRFVAFSSLPPAKGKILIMTPDVQGRAPLKLIPAR